MSYLSEKQARSANKRKNLSVQAYEYLLEQLLNHELQSGNFIEPHEIASKLGMSTVPVIRVLQRLAHEGFVKIINRKGTFVENSNPKSIFRQMMMREAIECQAALIYCGKPVENNLDRLIALATAIEEIPVTDLEHLTKEIEYHSFLVSLSGCLNLTQSVKLSMQLGHFLRLNLFYRGLTHAESHVELTRSLATSDPDEAARIIRHHLRSGKPVALQELEIAEYKIWKDI